MKELLFLILLPILTFSLAGCSDEVPTSNLNADTVSETKKVEQKADVPTLKETQKQDAPIAVPAKKKTSSGSYACNCAKTCPNLSCAEAQYQLNKCGCSQRDADHDGVACDADCQ